MESKDYLEREFDRFGQVLGRMLAFLLGLQKAEKTIEAHHYLEENLKKELALGLDDLVNLPDDSFINILKNEKYFNNNNLLTLAEILSELAEKFDSDHSNFTEQCRTKCLIIYDYLEKEENIMHFNKVIIRNKLSGRNTDQD